MIGQLTDETRSERGRRPSMLEGELHEYYRLLLRRLRWPAPLDGHGENHSQAAPKELRTLGVTSSARGEGASTIAWQLAATAAEMDEGSVLLVDANLTHPAVHENFRCKLSPGLAESLLDPKTLEANVHPTVSQHLAVLTAGIATSQVRKAFDGVAIDEVVDILRPHYDLIVFDMPPTDEQSTALRLAALLDGTLLVVEAERVSREDARRTVQLLGFAGAHVLGAVLNKRRGYPAKRHR